MWQSGTALYYVLRTGEFGWPGYAELIYLNVPLMVALTYLTVAFQVSFPFLDFIKIRFDFWTAFCVSAKFGSYAARNMFP